MIVGELHNLLQILQLLLFKLLTGHGFQFLIPVLVIHISAHGYFSSCMFL